MKNIKKAIFVILLSFSHLCFSTETPNIEIREICHDHQVFLVFINKDTGHISVIQSYILKKGKLADVPIPEEC